MTTRIEHAIETALQLGEVGVQVAAYIGDELVVDLAAGEMGPGEDRTVAVSTLFPIFSATKAFVATAVHLLAERGHIDYDDSVAKYWPEFGQAGKAGISVRQVLSHRAGIPQMPYDVTEELHCSWSWMTSRLAQMEPLFRPGSVNSYHSLTWGWILGEIVRRSDPAGRTLPDFIRAELCEPLGVKDFFLGLPESEFRRVASLTQVEPETSVAGLIRLTMPEEVFPSPDLYSQAHVLQAGIPGAGGIATARSVARLFALLANRGQLGGVRLLSEERVRAFTTPRVDHTAEDVTVGRRRAIGAYGYWLGGYGLMSERMLGSKTSVIGHPGAGGTVGLADIDTGLAFAITHNRMFPFESVPDNFHPFLPLCRELFRLAS